MTAPDRSRDSSGPASRPVTVEERPYNAETPMEALTDALTPTPLFYVRNHFDAPRIDPQAWRLTVDGAVDRVLELTLPDLQTLPHHSVVMTLECAGNGRAAMEPRPGGTPWGYGAAGTARFTGAPLHLLLERAGVQPGAVEALFTGSDRGEVEPGRAISFARSLSVDLARRADVLLAWEMNERPLTDDHGSPLRLVVPGSYGVASVKWLVSISLLKSAFEGYFQKERYVYAGEKGTPEGMPVGIIRVRAVIGRPLDGSRLPPAPVDVAGVAWSGDAPIERVELSADGGESWSEAELGTEPMRGSATAWRYRWVPPGTGTYTLLARATDAAGNRQPLESVWNALGYGNNAAQRVGVTVAREGPT